jgi:hypothetical protein
LRNSAGHPTKRDIVQFVRFREFAVKGKEELAEHVLKEVPDQFVSYMMSHGIKPQHIEQNIDQLLL